MNCNHYSRAYPEVVRDYKILPAPNRYRKLDNTAALELMKQEFPNDSALGIEMCVFCWDEILVWKNNG